MTSPALRNAWLMGFDDYIDCLDNGEDIEKLSAIAAENRRLDETINSLKIENEDLKKIAPAPIQLDHRQYQIQSVLGQPAPGRGQFQG